MHSQFAELTPRWFKRAFVYTGSIGDFRYRFDMGKEKGILHTAVYSVYCYEVAQDRQERFPMGRGRCGGAEAVASGEIRSVFRRERSGGLREQKRTGRSPVLFCSEGVLAVRR